MAGGSTAGGGAGDPKYFGSGNDPAMYAATGMAFGDDWKNTDRDKIFTYDGEVWLVRGEMSKSILRGVTDAEEGMLAFQDAGNAKSMKIVSGVGLTGASGFIVRGGTVGSVITYCNCGTDWKCLLNNSGTIGNYVELSGVSGRVQATGLGAGVYGRRTENGSIGVLTKFEFLLSENF